MIRTFISASDNALYAASAVLVFAIAVAFFGKILYPLFLRDDDNNNATTPALASSSAASSSAVFNEDSSLMLRHESSAASSPTSGSPPSAMFPSSNPAVSSNSGEFSSSSSAAAAAASSSRHQPQHQHHRRRRQSRRNVLTPTVGLAASVVVCAWCMLQHDSMFFTSVFCGALFWCLSHLYFAHTSIVKSLSMLWTCFVLSNVASIVIDCVVPEGRQFFQVLARSGGVGAVVVPLDTAATTEDASRSSSSFSAFSSPARKTARECDTFSGARHVGLLDVSADLDDDEKAFAADHQSSVYLYHRDGSLDGFKARAHVSRRRPLVISGDNFELKHIQLFAFDSQLSSHPEDDNDQQGKRRNRSGGSDDALVIVAGGGARLRNVSIVSSTTATRATNPSEDENLSTVGPRLPFLAIVPSSARLRDITLLRRRHNGEDQQQQEQGVYIHSLFQVLLHQTTTTQHQQTRSGGGGGGSTIASSPICHCTLFGHDKQQADGEDHKNRNNNCSLDVLLELGYIRIIDSPEERNSWVWPCASFTRRAAMLVPGWLLFVRSAAHTLFPVVSSIGTDVVVPYSKLAASGLTNVVGGVVCGFVDAATTTTTTTATPETADHNHTKFANLLSSWFVCSPAMMTEVEVIGVASATVLDDNISTCENSDHDEQSINSVIIRYSATIRTVVRELSLTVSFLAGSVGWRVVVWCWNQELHIVLAIVDVVVVVSCAVWQCAVAAAYALVPFIRMIQPEVILWDYLAPVCFVVLSFAWDVIAVVWRWYVRYVVLAVQMEKAVYAALVTPFVEVVKFAAAVAWGVVEWSLTAMLAVTFRVHVVMTLAQTAALVYMVWHAPAFAHERNQQQALPATALQVMAASVFGSRYTSWLNWDVVSRLVQHGYFLATSLAKYAYQNLSVLLLVFFLRMLPFTGFLSLLVESIAFPVVSTRALAEAMQLDVVLDHHHHHHNNNNGGKAPLTWQRLVIVRFVISAGFQMMLGNIFDALLSELMWLMFVSVCVALVVAGIRTRSFFSSSTAEDTATATSPAGANNVSSSSPAATSSLQTDGVVVDNKTQALGSAAAAAPAAAST